jgi:hypothetical protein
MQKIDDCKEIRLALAFLNRHVSRKNLQSKVFIVHTNLLPSFLSHLPSFLLKLTQLSRILRYLLRQLDSPPDVTHRYSAYDHDNGLILSNAFHVPHFLPLT